MVPEGDAFALRIRDLSKTFAGTRALDQVSFDAAPGSVHALLGGNGSGKSTLIKILGGIQPGDPGGTIKMRGSTLRADHVTPADAKGLGLRFVHQDLGLFSTLSIAENLAHGRGFERGRIKRISWRRQRIHAAELLELNGIDARPEDPVNVLRPAEQTMLAVARALQDDAETSILVLDEPTAALAEAESDHLLKAMRQYADAGQTVIFVSHRIDEVLEVADTVTILRDGKHVVTRAVEGLGPRELAEEIIGRRLDRFYPEAPAKPVASPVACRVDGLYGGPIRGVSFAVHEGEVLGLAGLVGSGRTELLQMIFGAHQIEAGSIALADREVDFRSPADAIRAGVAYIPEDRAEQAIFLRMGVRENITISTLDRAARWGKIAKRSERRRAKKLISDYGVIASSAELDIAALSGGNQQKVVLGRWLSGAPRLLLLDEPTQGVDVGARAELYQLLRGAIADGAAAIVVSSDLDELVHVSDRVVVLGGGEIRAELQAPVDSGHLTELAHQR